MCLAFTQTSHSLEHLGYMDYKKEHMMHPKSTRTVGWKTIIKYEQAVTTVLPEAKNWTFTEWSDEHNVLDGLIAKYGADYYGNHEAFHRLICLIEDIIACDDEDILWFIHSITNLPMTLAQVLWPDHTTVDYIQMFVDIYHTVIAFDNEGVSFEEATEFEAHPYGYYAIEYFRDCWLYKLVKTWHEESSIPDELSRKVKKIIFDAEMTN